jgi:hypothetical protein
MLCLSAAMAGWTPLMVRCERKYIDERLLAYFEECGGIFADIDSPDDLQDVLNLAKKLSTAGTIDMLIVDGLATTILRSLSEKLLRSSDGRAVYGGNLNTNIRFLFGLDNLTVPTILTCLRKSDKLYEGGPDAAPTREIFMPDLPGQLETRLPGVGCDLVGELVADGSSRTLYIEPTASRQTRIPTGSGMRNLRNPTVHLTHGMLSTAPPPRMTYEEAVKYLKGETN